MRYYPNLGSAIADQIQDQAAYNDLSMLDKFMQDQVAKVKVALRELDVNLSNAIRERNAKIAAINALPESDYKDMVREEFIDIDNGGWFTPSFETQMEAVRSVMSSIGVDSGLPELQTLGAIQLALIPVAGWVAAVSSIAIIGALATYFLTQAARYTALVINPDIYDPSATTAFADSLGSGAKYALIIAALGGAAYFMMKDKVFSK